MQRVESMMGTIVTAFEKQLDMLFGSEAMDISADITVLENMMKREGLSEDDWRAACRVRHGDRLAGRHQARAIKE